MFAKKDGQTIIFAQEQLEGFLPIEFEYSSACMPAVYFDESTQTFKEDAALKAEHTLKLNKEAKTMRRKSWQDFGSNLLAEILELNSAKYESGAINLAQLTAMYDDAGLLKIERALKLGDLKAARALIAQLDNSIYSADEKASLVSKLNNKIGV